MRMDGVVFPHILHRVLSKDKINAAASDHTIIKLNPFDQDYILKQFHFK